MLHKDYDSKNSIEEKILAMSLRGLSAKMN
jgi:hypothetical protein